MSSLSVMKNIISHRDATEILTRVCHDDFAMSCMMLIQRDISNLPTAQHIPHLAAKNAIFGQTYKRGADRLFTATSRKFLAFNVEKM